jgi:hypothetical protein
MSTITDSYSNTDNYLTDGCILGKCGDRNTENGCSGLTVSLRIKHDARPTNAVEIMDCAGISRCNMGFSVRYCSLYSERKSSRRSISSRSNTANPCRCASTVAARLNFHEHCDTSGPYEGRPPFTMMTIVFGWPVRS